ncbi:MAG: threonine transporter [Acidobacteriota bacterium]|nr:threonine transporter [Acidobacteriota bacterium]
MTDDIARERTSPFNSPIETGLRMLCLLSAGFPTPCSLQRLVVFDYLVVHSDDIPGGPPGLHPQTPHRSGEILVRRGVLQSGLLLYQSRGLIDTVYTTSGVFYAATDQSAPFLDVLSSSYVAGLRDRADWVVEGFSALSDTELDALVRQHIGQWGAEFALESVLWAEEQA